MNGPIKIAVPTNGPGGMDAPRSAHFGHADSFTLIEVADGAVGEALTVSNPPHSHGGCGLTVKMLADAGAGAAIVVGMGGGPMAAMNSYGMTAYFDDRSATPRAAVEAYLAGTLQPFGNDHTCKGH
jgi:predicted Fe-Mo cluster-binding NifX family protein